MKPCTKCGMAKPLAEFYKHPGAKDGHRGDCKVCVLAARRARYEADGDTLRERVRRYRQQHPDRAHTPRAKERARRNTRRRYLRETYGITPEEFTRMFDAQEYRCAVCRTDDPVRYWTVDHDHVTGAVRGILCWHCNVGLGHFRDDIVNLIAAADYLIRALDSAPAPHRAVV